MKTLLTAFAIVLAIPLFSQDLIVKTNQDTIKVKITKVTKSVIEHHLPFDMSDSQAQCKKVFSGGFQCVNMTYNSNKLCEKHHDKEIIKINRDEVTAFRMNGIWKLPIIEEEEEAELPVEVNILEQPQIEQNSQYYQRIINLENQINASGEYFNKASENYHVGLGLTLGGFLLSGLGAATGTPELGVVGGAAFITGFVFTISAWGKIDKAGDALTGKPYK